MSCKDWRTYILSNACLAKTEERTYCLMHVLQRLKNIHTVSSFMYILEVFISVLVKFLIRIKSNPDIAPPFGHRNFWRYTKAGDKSKYYLIWNFFHRLSTTLREGGAISGKGKAVPLQARSGPEGSRKLSFPDFVTTAQDDGKVVSLTHRPPLPPGNAPGTHFC